MELAKEVKVNKPVPKEYLDLYPQLIIFERMKSGESGGPWFSGYRFGEDRYSPIEITCFPSGCGAAIIKNYNYVSNVNGAIAIVKLLLPELRDSGGVGSIFTTVGQDFFNQGDSHRCMKFINELGFKSIVEYSNYRHGRSGSYKQRLYQLIL